MVYHKIHFGVCKIRAKTAQVTVFVILGLVLLIVALLLIFLRQKLKPANIDLNKILDELESGKIKNHITSCMNDVALEGLSKLGANGGVIYNFEGGKIPFNASLLGENFLNYTASDVPYFVAYGLRKNIVCNKINYTIRGYPYPDIKLSALNAIYNSNCFFESSFSAYDGFYGQSTLPKLCYIGRDSGCTGFAKGSEIGLTMQKQLEDYISGKLPLCVNFNEFTEKMSADITIESAPHIEVNIHDQDVLVVAFYPVKITFEKQEPVTRLINYQATLDIRLERLYNFLYSLLSANSNNPDFNLEKEFITSPFWRNSLDIKKINNPCAACSLPLSNDYLLEIVDRESLINGKPFIFRTAIEHRRPALDFIENLNYTLMTDDVVNYTLEAFSPDGDNLSYYFLSFGPDSPIAWHENDVILKDNLKKGLLQFPISKLDLGEHRVGIVAVDEHGMFDYQDFRINITDAEDNFDINPSCINDCIVFSCSKDLKYACVCFNATQWNIGEDYSNHFWCGIQSVSSQIPRADCEQLWCKIAANQCRAECAPDGAFASWQDTYNTDCWKCVYPIIHATEPHPHVDCPSLNIKETCLASMPKCFWTKQNTTSTAADGEIIAEFKESCINDTGIKQLNHPSFIFIT
jgi:hypothetical protein